MSVQALPRATGLPAIRFGRGLAAKIGVVVLAIILLGLFSSVEMGVFWGLGMSFGFILQRSRLCFASAFRDMFLMREGRNMKAILAGIAVATAGFALLMQKAVPDPAAGAFPDQAHVVPTGLYLVVGGLLFGVGMVVAGGCVSGSMYRVGEGYVASGVALLGVLVGLEAAAHSWNFWFQFNISTSPIVWLPSSLGYGGALLLTGVLWITNSAWTLPLIVVGIVMIVIASLCWPRWCVYPWCSCHWCSCHWCSCHWVCITGAGERD